MSEPAAGSPTQGEHQRRSCQRSVMVSKTSSGWNMTSLIGQDSNLDCHGPVFLHEKGKRHFVQSFQCHALNALQKHDD